jgi:predicted nucleic acid-binding protein
MSQEFQNNNAVITDTSCFILLDKIDAFPILRSLYQNVITTPEIAGEFGKPLPDWIHVKSVENKELQNSYLEKVDIGEASAIALAMELSSPLLILDDLKGRKLASQLNLKYTGTLGVLILARQKGIIPLLKPYFEKIKETDFRIAPDLLQKILEELGE